MVSSTMKLSCSPLISRTSPISFLCRSKYWLNNSVWYSKASKLASMLGLPFPLNAIRSNTNRTKSCSFRKSPTVVSLIFPFCATSIVRFPTEYTPIVNSTLPPPESSFLARSFRLKRSRSTSLISSLGAVVSGFLLTLSLPSSTLRMESITFRYLLNRESRSKLVLSTRDVELDFFALCKNC